MTGILRRSRWNAPLVVRVVSLSANGARSLLGGARQANHLNSLLPVEVMETDWRVYADVDVEVEALWLTMQTAF